MKVAIEDIMEMIDKEKCDFHHFPDTNTTVYYLAFKDGYSTTGVSACVDPNEFNLQMGIDAARQNAINNVWPLAGYRLHLTMRYPDNPYTCFNHDETICPDKVEGESVNERKKDT